MRVLLAIDGSKDSLHAAEFFCRLPHDQSIEIEVLSVINAPDLSLNTSTEAWLPDYIDQLERSADLSYAQVEAYFEGSNSKLSHHKVNGHVGNAIVSRATDIAADLVVIGAVGHSAVTRMLLGSVSDFVATHCKCAVLVVRPPHDGAGDSKALRVTVAYDGSQQSERALAHFGQFSWIGSVAVQVLTVVQRFRQLPYEVPRSLLDQFEQERAAAEEKSVAIVAKLQSQHVNAECNITESEHVGEAVVRRANEFQSDLIVLGNTGRSLIPRILLGSVSSYVLRHARQSVWIVR